jgi:signal transduction histidine kinase
MGALNEAQETATGIVANKTEVLSRLVDDIISMLRVGKEQIRTSLVSLADIGHASVQAARVSAVEAGLTLNDEIPDGLPPVLGDKRRLGQVFDNLLQNAIKFSQPGGAITVRMRVVGLHIRAEVQDTGIGIPRDQLSRIFDRFYQVDGTTTRRFGGTGLGLAIVKQIVEAHGGQVGVESKVDKGSLFYFTIPQATSSNGEEVYGHNANKNIR